MSDCHRAAVLFFLMSIVLLPGVPAGEVFGVLTADDPDEAERWEEAREYLLANPIDPKRASIADLTVLPGISDSVAAHLIDRARSDPASLPGYARGFFRSESKLTASLRLRGYAADPHESRLWRRSGNSVRASTAWGDAWNAAMLLERDPHEPGIVDHAGFSVSYTPPAQRWSVVGGQYRAHVGHGLIVGRYQNIWIDYDAFRRYRQGIAGTVAAIESGALVGIAAHSESDRFTITTAVARPRWDATVTDEGVVTRLRTEGIHVTEGQRAGKNAVAERFGLFHITFRPARGVSAGATVAAADFTLPISFAPHRLEPEQRLSWYGIDAQWNGEKHSVSTEAAIRESGVWAGSALTTYHVGSIELLAVTWSYDPEYAGPHGGSWSFRDGIHDERALAGGMRWRLGRARIDYLAAVYAQHHAGRLDPNPRNGTWEQVRIALPLHRHVAAETRWRMRSIHRPGQGAGSDESRSEWRAAVRFGSDRNHVRVRTDYVTAKPEGQGALGVLYTRVSRGSVSLRSHAGVFRVNHSKAAVYIYEPRATGYGIMRGLFNTGVAWGTLAELRIRGADLSAGLTGVSRKDGRSTVTVAAQLTVRVD